MREFTPEEQDIIDLVARAEGRALTVPEINNALSQAFLLGEIPEPAPAELNRYRPKG